MLRNFFAIRAQCSAADVIHAIDVFPYGILAALTSFGLKKPLIITAIGTGSVLPLHRWFAPLARWVLRRAVYRTAISRFTAREIEPHIGKPVAVITPALQEEDFAFSEETEVSDTQLHLKPYVVSVGALRRRKGYIESVSAFARVARVMPELRYVIVGKRLSGGYYDALTAHIKKCGLEGRVILVENADTKKDVYAWLRGAEIFCLYSRNTGHDVEGFGIVFLEAAACGLPVVGTKGCGIDDAVADGKNGLLVAEENTEGFAQAILTILGDSSLHTKMAEYSKEFARQFRWDEKIREYVVLYRSV